ncbi:MAG TPA: SpoIIE family protein phosphatase [Spirochaetota bacterium]|nr:SpoIIE family protein phosphatase [Spirochaetota bacterium]HPC43048.1 SpoIIE family protein phosphatase [Spirochaetota bacterium]HPL17714.1 SpoIIE family protein phosphatase [Spirochaetota bacterium]HQF09457.1 SpoIIE family protein phosphatase [Spirochaetota bacterium]HQH98140.1 SpoIIE family protein phosphatase [Spirochaetota bacterium]
MNVVSTLLLFSFLIYLYLGITTYQLNRQSRINIQMLVVCMNFALWSFAYAFMHISEDVDVAFCWYHLSTFGWLFFIPFILHLVMLLSRNEHLTGKVFYLVVYGTPAAAFIWVNGFLIDTSLMHRVSGGWITVYDIGPVWIFLYLTAYYLVLGIAWYALYRWGKKSPHRRVRKQVRIFLVTSIISLTGASVFDNILPFAGVVRYPLIAPIIILVWMFGLWYAIHKYGMMKIDTSFAASTIINSMNDLLFLSDHEGFIRQTNPHTRRIMEMEQDDITGKAIHSLIRERELVGDAISRFKESPLDHDSIEVNIMPRAGSDIPVRLSMSALRDSEGDLLGVVFVGYDLRENRQLRKFQAMMQVEMEMAAQIQSRLFHSTPPDDTAWEISTVFRPLLPVSGDFYDFYQAGDTLRGVSLFDVSGHGVSAGLITIIARSLVFKGFNAMRDRPLDEVLTAINNELVKEIGKLDDFMTGMLIRFNDGTAEYVNAGHTHLLMRSAAGDVSVIDNAGQDIRGGFLGIDSIVPKFTVVTFEVNPGDLILAYTDGLVECIDSAKNRYGLDRLVDSFRRAPAGSTDGTMARIIGDMERFIGNRPLRDDLTAILLRRR